jgi:hypothetical protein
VQKKPAAVYAVDVTSRNLFPIEQVQLVQLEQLRTPQKGGIIAFKDQDKADQFISKYKAEKVKLDDLLN